MANEQEFLALSGLIKAPEGDRYSSENERKFRRQLELLLRRAMPLPQSGGSGSGFALARATLIIAHGLADGISVDGTIDVGATSILMRLVAEATAEGLWLRVYGNADDRTTDAARTDPTDPALAPIILDHYFDDPPDLSVWLGTNGNFGFRGVNQDDPVNGYLYYRLTRIDGGGTTGTAPGYNEVAFDDTDSPGPGDQNLVDHIPSDPLSSSWTLWEYTTQVSDPDRYEIRGSSFGIQGTQTDAVIARTNVNFIQGKIRVWSDVFRLGVDAVGSGAGLALLVPSTAIGSYGNDDYVIGKLQRATVGTVDLEIAHVEAGGTTETQLGTSLGLSMGLNTGVRLIFERDGDVLNLYTADYTTGANETLRVTVALPSEYTATFNRRVGWRSTIGSSSGFVGVEYHIESGDFTPAVPEIELTYLTIERGPRVVP